MIISENIIKKVLVLKNHFNKKMFILLIGNVLTILFNILSVKLLTNKFSTSDFGEYSLIISSASFFQLVLFAPISASIMPFINREKEKNRYSTFQQTIFSLFNTIAFALLGFGIIFCCFNYIFEIVSIDVIFILFTTILFSSSLSWLTILDSFSLANSHISYFTIFPLINIIIKVFFIFLLFYFWVSPTVLILFYSFFQVCLSILEYKFLSSKKIITYKILDIFNFKCFKITPLKKEVINYSKNYAVWGIFGASQTFLDKIILNHFLGADSVAIYSVYYQYSFVPFTIFASIISQYISPIYFSKVGNVENETNFYKSLFIYISLFLTLFLLIVSIASYFIAPFIIRLLSNSYYLVEITYFPILVVSACLYFAGQILTIPLSNNSMISSIRLPKISTSIIAIAFFYVLTFFYGFKGILLALLASNLVYFIWMLKININKFKQLQILNNLTK